jgi:RNA polymerase II subunit A C-terminal domain phosphatase SSU72
VYRFGTPYQDMYSDLSNQDTSLYTRNGILALLDRNKNIKPAPERFQDNHLVFNVLITCEQRCFDAVCEELMRRGGINNKPVHVINVEIKDSIEEASKGAQIILSVANELRSAEQMLEERIWDILEEARVKHGDIFLYHVSYY